MLAYTRGEIVGADLSGSVRELCWGESVRGGGGTIMKTCAVETAPEVLVVFRCD